MHAHSAAAAPARQPLQAAPQTAQNTLSLQAYSYLCTIALHI